MADIIRSRASACPTSSGGMCSKTFWNSRLTNGLTMLCVLSGGMCSKTFWNSRLTNGLTMLCVLSGGMCSKTFWNSRLTNGLTMLCVLSAYLIMCLMAGAARNIDACRRAGVLRRGVDLARQHAALVSHIIGALTPTGTSISRARDLEGPKLRHYVHRGLCAHLSPLGGTPYVEVDGAH